MRVSRICRSAFAACICVYACGMPPAIAGKQHLVRHGENVEGLARRYRVSVRQIVAVNRLADANRIREGSTLVIPSRHHGQPAARTAYRRTRVRRAVDVGNVHTSRALRVSRSAMPSRSLGLVRTALTYRGTPYRYGGSSRGGFDCSGFTRYVFRGRGVALPHSARAQFHVGAAVGRAGLKPGDLVFFHTVTRGISHVGIYVGDGKFVHASSRRSDGVRVDSLRSGYYERGFRGARRVTPRE